MPHAAIENRTPFAFADLYLADEEGRPVVVTVIRASYEIVGRRLRIAEQQAPVPLGGELNGTGGADRASYRLEPEAAFVKPATDVVLLGHARPPRFGASESSVSLQVGSLTKTVAVIGDRTWVKSAGGIAATRPQPFERIPLIYERAFGGWDRSAGTPERPAFEPRNPVGTGFRAPSGRFEEGIVLPNFEDPDRRLGSYGDVVPPAGFGFVSPNWQPRAALGGTYDAAWSRERMPRLPADFDRRFFNAASPGLVSRGYLRGDEPVAVVGTSPGAGLSFQLPAVARPTVRVGLLRGDEWPAAELDTLVVDSDEDRVYLTWRAHVVLRDGPHDVLGIDIETPGLTAPAQAAASA
jgi:hypothetical protein